MKKTRRVVVASLIALLVILGGIVGGVTYYRHAAQPVVRDRVARVRMRANSSTSRQASSQPKPRKNVVQAAVTSDRIPLSKWQKQSTPVQLPILMYHDIGQGNTLMMPADQLKNQLTWLKQAGYYELTPAEAYTVLSENKVPQAKIVWITFDDGYRSMYTTGLPLFKETNSRVTINEISGSVGSNWNLTAEMIKTMQQNNVDFASHTVSHLELNKLPNARQQMELTNSRQTLAQITGTAPNTIAYPVGRYNVATLQYAKAAGYQMGLTTTPGLAAASQGMYALHRVRVNPGQTQAGFLNLVQHGY